LDLPPRHGLVCQRSTIMHQIIPNSSDSKHCNSNPPPPAHTHRWSWVAFSMV